MARIPTVSGMSPDGAAPSNSSAIRQQSSMVALAGGNSIWSLPRPPATAGSRPSTAPELTNGSTCFRSLAASALKLWMLTSVAYTPGRVPATQQQPPSSCLPQTTLTL